MKEVRKRKLFKAGTPAIVVLALAIGLLLPVVPAFTAADTLPTQISDEAFWKIIESFSEDGG